jgi:TolB-like protein
MVAFAAQAAHAQVRLDTAVQDAAGELSAVFERGYGVAVLAMRSDSTQMSDHLVTEMIIAFMRMQHARGITVVNRMQLNTFAAQLDFSTTDMIDEVTAQSLGTHMNVRYVVTGSFESNMDLYFRFAVQVMDLETAAILGTYADVQIDGLVASMMGIGYSPAPVPRRDTGSPMLQDPARFWSVGLSMGTLFMDGYILGSLYTTIAPWSNWFIRIGCDVGYGGIYSGNENMVFSMWRTHFVTPFVHFAFFRPFAGRGGWYIGTGLSVSMARYRYEDRNLDHWREADRTIVALDLTLGVNLGDRWDISYTLQTPFSTVLHRVSIGYTWRIQQRSE